MPNFLNAVGIAVSTDDPDAALFAGQVVYFLNALELKREAERLIARSQTKTREVGSRAWFWAQTGLGEQFYESGQAAEGACVFREILTALGDTPSYDRAITLGRLARGLILGGQPQAAATHVRAGLEMAEKLEGTDEVRRLQATLHTDLADGLAELGHYPQARTKYEAALAIATDLGDLRGQGSVWGHLGTLAMREGNLDDAQGRFQDALALFRRLGEHSGEAIYLHQLGTVFQRREQWEEAERHYRESARLAQEGGDLQGAAQTWNQLAILNKDAGRPAEAEEWYRKSIDAKRKAGNVKDTSACLFNLANLLRTQPDHLAEARESAEEALKLLHGLDPAAVEIWRHLKGLALIAEQQAAEASDHSRRDQFLTDVRRYRRLGIEARVNFPGTRHHMQVDLPLIRVVVVATQNKIRQDQLLLALPSPEAGGQDKLVAAIRRVLEGERDEDNLGEGMDSEESTILHFILRGIADPSTLNELMPDEPPAE